MKIYEIAIQRIFESKRTCCLKRLHTKLQHLVLATLIAGFGGGSTNLQLRVLSVSSFGGRADSDDSLMDSGLNGVILGNVKLGKGVTFESTHFFQISEGRGIDQVSVGQL